MALATGSHTVLEFVHVQFLGDWTRWSGTQMIGYTSNREAINLMVVVEDAQAVKTTYWFRVGRQLDVWIDRNVIHIPAICVRSAAGNRTRCRG
jgi:hypothetical protein